MSSTVIFDMDRTLVRKDTAGLFIRYEWDVGLASTLDVLKVAWWRLEYTLGLLNAQLVAKRALEWYKGRTETDLREHAKVWFREYAQKHITQAARDAVKRHQDAGDLVIMATAATKFASEPIAADFGIEHVVCSELETRDGCLTGNVIEPLCYEEGKVARLEEFLAKHNKHLAEATVYTDSITDLPLLEAVESPVVVNPDPRLRAVAKERAWPIQLW